MHQFYLYRCSSKDRHGLLAVLSAQQCFLHAIALILAFRTRKVKVKGLDDSKYVVASVYMTSCVLAATIITIFSLTPFVNIYPVVIGAGHYITTITILILVFIPKVSNSHTQHRLYSTVYKGIGTIGLQCIMRFILAFKFA